MAIPVRQDLLVLEATKDVNGFKSSLFECISHRIHHSQCSYGVGIDRKDKIVVFTDAGSEIHLGGLTSEWRDCITAAPLFLSTTLSTPSNTSFDDVFKSPVIELAFFFFDELDSEWEPSMGGLERVIASEARGHMGTAWGWASNSVHHTSLGDLDGKCFIMITGWRSVEAHQTFRSTDKFMSALEKVGREHVKASDWFYVAMETT